jgi:protein arginine kinase
MDALASQLTKIGLTVRGVFGEGSGSVGCMYQISNQISLGLKEADVLSRLTEAVKQISENERKQRKSITGDALDRLTDRCCRSAGILRTAYMISTAEFIRLFADVRYGITMGILTDIPMEKLNTLLVEAMPATLTLSSDSTPKTEAVRDKLRAQKIKDLLNTSGGNAIS